MMKKVKLLIIALAIIAVVSYLLSVMNRKTPVNAVVASKGTVYEYVEEQAKTSLPRICHLSMPFDGRIMPITVREGNPVKKKQIVAVLDRSDLKTRIARINAQKAAVEGEIVINKFDAIEKTALQESKGWIATMLELIKATQNKIKANQSVYKYAKEYETTLEKSGGSVSRIKKSEAKKDAAIASVETETAQITHKIMELLHQIFTLCPVYINEFLKIKELRRDVMKNRLLEIQAILDQAYRDLKRTAISSPIDGVVLKRYYSNERVLAAGTPLLDIGNLEQLEVTADILSQDVVSIKVGNNVDIYGPAIGENPVKGKVTRIDPAGFTKISSLGVEQQRVHVTISFNRGVLTELADKGKSLGNGYRVRVKIYTARAEQVITVPRTTIFKGDKGNWELFRIIDGKAVLSPVKVGLVNDQSAEITNGLNEGEPVIIAPPASLKTGTNVSYSDILTR